MGKIDQIERSLTERADKAERSMAAKLAKLAKQSKRKKPAASDSSSDRADSPGVQTDAHGAPTTQPGPSGVDVDGETLAQAVHRVHFESGGGRGGRQLFQGGSQEQVDPAVATAELPNPAMQQAQQHVHQLVAGLQLPGTEAERTQLIAHQVAEYISAQLLGQGEYLCNAADETLAKGARVRPGRRVISLVDSPVAKVGPGLDSIVRRVAQGGGDAAEALRAALDKSNHAPTNAKAFARQVQSAVTTLQDRISACVRKGNHEGACTLLQESRALEREYEQKFLPLVQLLGHKEAFEF